jgi:hypothetical protein
MTRDMKRKEIERLARKMCAAATQLDPDTMFVHGEPYRFREGHIVDTHHMQPLWMTFWPEAMTAYDEIEMFKSAAPAVSDATEDMPQPFDFGDEPTEQDVAAAKSWRERQGL